MDALALLAEDHRTIDAMLRRFEAGQGNVELFRELERELSIHAAIEETELYPAMRDAMSAEYWRIDHALEDHQTVKQLLSEMEDLVPYTPDFRSRMTKLAKAVREHVHEEETKLFPLYRRHTPPAELAELGETLAEAKRSAPTRSRANQVVGAAAAVVDVVRDKLGI